MIPLHDALPLSKNNHLSLERSLGERQNTSIPVATPKVQFSYSFSVSTLPSLPTLPQRKTPAGGWRLPLPPRLCPTSPSLGRGGSRVVLSPPSRRAFFQALRGDFPLLYFLFYFFIFIFFPRKMQRQRRAKIYFYGRSVRGRPRPSFSCPSSPLSAAPIGAPLLRHVPCPCPLQGARPRGKGHRRKLSPL